jgi:rhamnosyltransferase
VSINKILKTEKKSSVAVLLAAYNGMKWIEEQVDSIFLQKDVDIDIYISVDISSDSTYEFCQGLAAKNTHIKVLPYGEKFGGAAKNFFRLISEVNFEKYNYVALSDQDDIWCTSKLSTAIKSLRQHNCLGYSSDMLAFWPNNKKKYLKKSYKQQCYDYYFESAGAGCTYVLDSNSLNIFKKKLVNNVELVSNIGSHDWLIYAFFRSNKIPWFIDERSFINYRQHENNVAGANVGFNAIYKRLVALSGGWFQKDFRNIVKFIESDDSHFSIKNKSKFFFIINFFKLRRRFRDSIIILLFILLGFYP